MCECVRADARLCLLNVLGQCSPRGTTFRKTIHQRSMNLSLSAFANCRLSCGGSTAFSKISVHVFLVKMMCIRRHWDERIYDAQWRDMHTIVHNFC